MSRTSSGLRTRISRFSITIRIPGLRRRSRFDSARPAARIAAATHRDSAMNRFAAALLLSAFAALPAAANDTMATLGTGGLTFINSENVKMLKEDLYVSPSEVRVRYEFRND